MKMIRLLSVILGMLILGPLCHAQQGVMFTQYMFNGLALNPAYAGSHDVISATVIGRQQWLGIDGAPNTQTLSVHSPIKNERIGLGMLLLRDQIGITDQLNATVAYSYRIEMDHGKLAMGLQGGISNYRADYNKLEIGGDPALSRGVVSAWQPNFGAGVYYYNDRFYAGLSVPQLLERVYDAYESSSVEGRGLVRHYFLNTGYVFDLNDDLKLKPNMLVKMVEGAPVQVDLNANLLIMEVLWVGLSWRSFDSVDGLLQLQLTDRLQLGYSYDFATTKEIQSVDGGSHELSLNYRFTIGHKKSVSPRYF